MNSKSIKSNGRYTFLALIGVIFLYSLLRLWLIQPLINEIAGFDEGVFAVSSRMIAQGYMPYQDFILAHPPLYYLVLAGLFKIFGYNFIIARLFSVIVSIACIFLVYLIGKRIMGPVQGLAAAVLCLVIPGASTVWFTVVQEPLGILFMLGGLFLILSYLKSKGHSWRIVVAGVLFGLALATKYLFIFAVAGISIAFIATGWRDFKRWLLVAGAAASFMLVCGYFMVSVPDAFFSQTIFSQVGQFPGRGDTFIDLTRKLTHWGIITLYWIFIPPITLILFLVFKGRSSYRGFMLLSVAVSWLLIFPTVLNVERYYSAVSILTAILLAGIIPNFSSLRERLSFKPIFSIAFIFILFIGSYFVVCKNDYDFKAQITYENTVFRKVVQQYDGVDGACSINPALAALSKNIQALPPVDLYAYTYVMNLSEDALYDDCVKQKLVIVDLYSKLEFHLSLRVVENGQLVNIVFPDYYIKGYVMPSAYRQFGEQDMFMQLVMVYKMD